MLNLFNRSVSRRVSDVAFAEPCFEAMENRLLLSVSIAEFNAIKAANPDLNLGVYKNYNIIEILASELSVANLKAAIDKAGTTAANDLIVLRTTATQNRITFAAAADTIDINIDAAAWGSVTIVSLGAAPLTINANQLHRVMYVEEDTIVGLAGLTIPNGKTTDHGGGIENYGTMTVTNSTIIGNSSTANDGGGIATFGTMALTNSIIAGNSAAWGGGGIRNDGILTVLNSMITGNSAADAGGGIYNNGTMTVTSSTLAGNSTTGSGGGIYSIGILTVTGSTFLMNTAAHNGGGINSTGTVTVTGATFTGNTATGTGGGINVADGFMTVTNSTLLMNTAANNGGGISNSGTLVLTDSTLTGNTVAGNGGGIRNYGTLAVTNSTLTGNQAGYGAGMYSSAGIVTVTSSTIAGNTATGGGGINVTGGTVTVMSSSITGNQASIHGGGIRVVSGGTVTVANSVITGNRASEDGGGIENNGTMTLTNTTIAGNTAGNTGGGIDAWSGSVTLENSIVIGNTAGTDNDIHKNGGATANGYSTLSTFTGWTAGSDNPAYDGTLPLFVNAAAGDYRLTPDSQARDMGDNTRALAAGVTNMTRDMAGNFRMVKAIDLGAYECQVTPAASVVTAKKAKATKAGITTQGADLTWAEAVGADGYWVEWYAKNTLMGAVWVSNVPGGTQALSIDGLQPGVTYSVRIYTTTAANMISTKFAKATVKTKATPSVAKLKAAATGPAEIVLTWNAPKPAAIPADRTLIGYNIYTAAGTLIGFVPAGTTTFTVDNTLPGVNLQPRTSYTFRVAAVFDPVLPGETVLSTKLATAKATTRAV